MPRIARIVIPGIPHHITQRGNRRQKTFFSEYDYQIYIDLMAKWCDKHRVVIWAYCLMPNHVHLIAVPEARDSLKKAIGEAHRRYTCMINTREEWRGYLWQGRFNSFPMDESYLLACARYIELNPVRAGICQHPATYAWSSARAHIENRDDILVRTQPLLDLSPNWSQFLLDNCRKDHHDDIRHHDRTGRPLGDLLFLKHIDTIEGSSNQTENEDKHSGHNTLL